ncbi:MAG: hypothetical protein GEU94_12710 [Micromonosporaceae bacterium]|nr:hypothetical protein [Micromonosporaceae bacterium]
MRSWGLLLVAPVLAGVVLLGSSPAYAHVKMTSSDPADGSQSRVPISEVTLRFSEQVNPELVKVAVTVDGKPARSTTQVHGSTVTTSVPERSGRFQVGYRVVSRDGHTVSGTIEFTVRRVPGEEPRRPGDPAPSATADSDATAPAGSATGPPAVVDGPATDAKGRSVTRSWVWVIVGLGGLGLLGALAYVLVSGRRKPSEGEATSVDTVDESGSRDS